MLLVVVCGLKLIAPKAAVAQQPIQKPPVGRRVVQRFNDFSLRIENRVVGRGRSIHFYRVDQASGPWLWLRSEGTGLSGWALADHVVPVEEGIAYFGRQVEANALDSFSYVMRALLWQDRNEIDKALHDYDQALKINPDQGWILNDRGILHFEKKDYERALADFNRAIALEPRSANVYNNRGTVHRTMTMYDQAIDDFSAAVQLDPGYAFAFYNRGLTWTDKKEYDKAIADFNEVLRLEPKDAVAYYNRGLAWAAKQVYDKAIADFDKVIEIDPNLPFAYLNRGLARAVEKQYDAAIADFDRTIRLRPNSVRAHYHRGLAWVEKKDYQKAIADFDATIRLNPGFDEAYLSRAWLLASCPDARLRDPKKAVESATKACELTNWHEAHDLGALAAVYAETGNVAAAVKWQSKAIELLTEDKSKAVDMSSLGHP